MTIMCLKCGKERGAGLGFGKGQRYERIGSHLGTGYVKTGGIRTGNDEVWSGVLAQNKS